MEFAQPESWVYFIELDEDSSLLACGIEEVTAKELELRLIRDSASLRERVQLNQQWFHTPQASVMLRVSEEQLRELRRNGRFRSSYHYRDASIPGSGRPYWQWHVDRCSKELEAASAKRATTRGEQ